eukprot:NODE_8573_length_1485_cov_5.722386.p1 GENE.NODE_8573_length_1485_cov_5.722386~~NODE_8573_length_1485_cov_5.722386.p1  ORF type:complete len:440 (-),score=47.55 NODE_8573_length_1485_cov_5.722386:84-1403(-)
MMESTENDDNLSHSLEDLPVQAMTSIAAPEKRQKPEMPIQAMTDTVAPEMRQQPETPIQGAMNMSAAEPCNNSTGDLVSAALVSSSTLAALSEGQAHIVKMLEQVLSHLNKDVSPRFSTRLSERCSGRSADFSWNCSPTASPRRVRECAPKRHLMARRSQDFLRPDPSVPSSDYSPFKRPLDLDDSRSPFNCEVASVNALSPRDSCMADAFAMDGSAGDQSRSAGEKPNAEGSPVAGEMPGRGRSPPLNPAVVMSSDYSITDALDPSAHCSLFDSMLSPRAAPLSSALATALESLQAATVAAATVPLSPDPQPIEPELPGSFPDDDAGPAADPCNTATARESFMNTTPPESEASFSSGTEETSGNHARMNIGLRVSRQCVYDLSAAYSEALFLQDAARRANAEASVRQAQARRAVEDATARASATPLVTSIMLKTVQEE